MYCDGTYYSTLNVIKYNVDEYFIAWPECRAGKEIFRRNHIFSLTSKFSMINWITMKLNSF